MGSILVAVTSDVVADIGPVEPGGVLAVDRYRYVPATGAPITTAVLDALGELREGGSIFVVTVRPLDERIWLVAVLDDPTDNDTSWRAATNKVATLDVTEALRYLRCDDDAGIRLDKGTALQQLVAPRLLTLRDEKILRAVIAKPASALAELGFVEAAPVEAAT